MGNCITELSTQTWNVVYASEIGTAHVRTAAPCQDYSSMQIVETEGQPVLVLCCADGAGSAQFAEVASKLACDELQLSVLNGLLYLRDVASIEHENVHSWYEGVRAKLEECARERGGQLSDFACTLLLAVLGPDVSLFAQVGDGAMVYKSETSDEYSTVFWPDNGEYMNITYFVTSPNLEKNLRVRHISDAIAQVAIFTDGLELLALDFKKKEAFGPFFRPMLERLSNEAEPGNLEPLLREFLQSAAVNKRTDDDKTLMLGSRVRRANEKDENDKNAVDDVTEVNGENVECGKINETKVIYNSEVTEVICKSDVTEVIGKTDVTEVNGECGKSDENDTNGLEE